MVDVTVTLIQLAFVSVIMTVALEQVFDTRLYQNYLGSGPDGKGSVLFKDLELRPWIATIIGIFLSFCYQLQAIKFGLGDEFLGKASALNENAKIVDMLLTGLIIGGGTKSIKKIANRLAGVQGTIKQVNLSEG